MIHLCDQVDTKMFNKRTIFFTATLFSFQVLAYTSIDDAELQLSILRDSVTTILNDALRTYRQLSERIDTLAQNTRFNGTRVIETYSEAYLQRYEVAKNKADATGVNITTCLVYIGDQLLNLAAENIDGLNVCINGEIDAGAEFIGERILATVDSSFAHAFDSEKMVYHCYIYDQACLESALFRISLYFASTRHSIEEIVSRAVNRVEGSFIMRIPDACGNRYTSIAIGKGESLATGFEDCINAHINIKSNT